MTVLDQLRAFARELEIIDTHEHLVYEADWVQTSHDVLVEWLSHYFSCDLISAGLPHKVMSDSILAGSLSVAEKWKLLEPFWNAARNTGYARSLDIAARDLYGEARVDGASIEKINKEFVARRKASAAGKSYYKTVLKDKCRIKTSLLDSFTHAPKGVERDFFTYIYRIDSLLGMCDASQLDAFAAQAGMAVHSLDDWKAVVEKIIDKAVAAGAAALKCAVAYERPLYFARPTAAEAETAFNKLLCVPHGPDIGPVRRDTGRVLEDFTMHWILTLADTRGLTIQVHTGLQEGNGNILSNSNPELLSNLFLEYTNVTFDVFHMSYPYQNVLSALAKNFPNVMIDMCWAHIISPEAAVRALVEFLDAVPANKISAFGGDYLFVDGVYGHQALARENVAKALAIKVDDGCFDVERAKEICRWLLFDNPRRIFKL